MTLQLQKQPSFSLGTISRKQSESHARFPRRAVQASVRYERGDVIFPAGNGETLPHLLVDGEILILRHGQPVELIEPGEYYDAALWRGTTAVAYRDCTLAPLTHTWSLSTKRQGVACAAPLTLTMDEEMLCQSA